jgi:hypothetical protein
MFHIGDGYIEKNCPCQELRYRVRQMIVRLVLSTMLNSTYVGILFSLPELPRNGSVR